MAEKLNSRREFFASLAALGMANLVGTHADLSVIPLDLGGAHGVRLDQLRPEDFAKHVGQTFTIHDGERRLQAELVKVETRRRGSAWGMSRQQFSVIFRLPGSEPVDHHTYTVEHPVMGSFDLFLGSVGQPSSSALHLEAAFA